MSIKFTIEELLALSEMHRLELEEKDKLIANSIPRGKVEAVRNNYMQFLSDSNNDDSEREIAQVVFDTLEEILTKGESNEN